MPIYIYMEPNGFGLLRTYICWKLLYSPGFGFLSGSLPRHPFMHSLFSSVNPSVSKTIWIVSNLSCVALTTSIILSSAVIMEVVVLSIAKKKSGLAGPIDSSVTCSWYGTALGMKASGVSAKFESLCTKICSLPISIVQSVTFWEMACKVWNRILCLSLEQTMRHSLTTQKWPLLLERHRLGRGQAATRTHEMLRLHINTST